MQEYKHLTIEKKWQKNWEENKTFKTNVYSDKKKFYALDMFPYPSGSGLHVGHPEGYTATDIISRMKRMQGFEVLHPIGWDAFGLPAEQYALKTGNHPKEFTLKNINNFRKQIKSLGFSYDWDREVNTTDNKYVKWTQWIFIQLYNRGLAELRDSYVNFCPECKTVLANEEVINGRCDRGNHLVEKRKMSQWYLKITHYAQRLLDDLDELDWPESLKEMQRNWIGKTQGLKIKFPIDNSENSIEVFTTRADTIFGVTYLVVSPESPLAKKIVTVDNKVKVEKFIKQIQNKSDLDRTDLNKDKSGIFTGSYATHPLTLEKLPIWLGDYVLADYQTGAVMAVPAHDARDFEFANKYSLKIVQVVENQEENELPILKNGIHINSDFLNGLENKSAQKLVTSKIIELEIGSEETSFKLRDWLFSRQRYWGEPFPVAHMEDGTIKILDNDELPVKLPDVKSVEVSQDGLSPLTNEKNWLLYTDPVTGQKGRREINTMPQWAGSCWYYLRYIDPLNDQVLVDSELAKKWLPVDLYIGGAEHAVLHLLYARFWHKVLYDIGIVDSKEPFMKLYNQGMILGENNEKMSKSKGNVINPDDIVKSHGADTLRIYEMFMGPLDAAISWSEDGLDGSYKFLNRVWRLYENLKIVDTNQMDKLYNQTVKKVTNDMEKLNFNTAISQLMIFVNEANKNKELTEEQATGFIKLLSPIAPHISEEINQLFLNNQELAYSKWPKFNESKLIDQESEIIIQINGKIKSKIMVDNSITKDQQLIISKNEISQLLVDKNIKREIVVLKKITNFVTD